MRETQGRDVVIAGAVRTPVGRGHPEKGIFRDLHPNELLGATYTALIERTGIDPLVVGDVVAGCVHQYGAQTYNVARNAWLQAGLPFEVPATTVDRQCGSGQQAVSFGAGLVAAGIHDVVIGSGVEHMGRVPMGRAWAWPDQVGIPWPKEFKERYDIVNQGISAETIADMWDISREELDELSVESHRRAATATSDGRFDRELVSVAGATVDQGIRPSTNAETLAGLKPAFREGGKITAGNASQISDGAAAVLLMSSDKCSELGLTPRARVVDYTTVGVDPVLMLTGPIPATSRMLSRNDLRIDDLDLIEVNEAFASVVLAWQREHGADLDRVNVNGGAIAIGHPLGSSGARLLTTLLHELERQDKEIGLVTMCCGGGLGTATLIQRL
jgi:acetyl-CoA acyltransferase